MLASEKLIRCRSVQWQMLPQRPHLHRSLGPVVLDAENVSDELLAVLSDEVHLCVARFRLERNSVNDTFIEKQPAELSILQTALDEIARSAIELRPDGVV